MNDEERRAAIGAKYDAFIKGVLAAVARVDVDGTSRIVEVLDNRALINRYDAMVRAL